MNDSGKIILAKDFTKTYIQLRKTIMEAPQSEDIKQNEFVLLIVIIDSISPEVKGIKVSELSTILKITPAAVTHMINSLEKKEYLERLSDKKDRRIVLVRPTETGSKVIESMKKQFFDDLKELLDFLGEKDSKALLRILNLVNSFHNQKKKKNT